MFADPTAQANDKRNPVQIYNFPKLPNIHILSLSYRTESRTTGSCGFWRFAEPNLSCIVRSKRGVPNLGFWCFCLLFSWKLTERQTWVNILQARRWEREPLSFCCHAGRNALVYEHKGAQQGQTCRVQNGQDARIHTPNRPDYRHPSCLVWQHLVIRTWHSFTTLDTHQFTNWSCNNFKSRPFEIAECQRNRNQDRL